MFFCHGLNCEKRVKPLNKVEDVLLGVLGGMGPLASAIFMERLTVSGFDNN